MLKMPLPTYPQPRDLVRKLTGELVNQFVKTVQKVDIPHMLFQELKSAFQKKIYQQSDLLYQTVVEQCRDSIKHHLHSQLQILIPTKEILKQNRGSYEPIKCKAKLVNDRLIFDKEIEIDCLVACGHWHRLGELYEDEIDLFDHFYKLIPQQHQRGIGLFTFQNGIQNTLEDFSKMGDSIIQNLEEKPLCIGLYNETNGIVYGIANDLFRFKDEWHFNTNSAVFLRQMMATFANFLSAYQNLLWTHIAHSEAGLIANVILTSDVNRFDSNQKKFIQRHCITTTFGAVTPIPEDVVLEAYNFYSVDDVTMLFARKYLDKTPMPPDNPEETALLRRAAEAYYAQMSEPEKSQAIEKMMVLFKQTQIEFYKKYYIENYPYDSFKDGYHITVVESQVSKEKQPFFEKDHAFQGKTYQTELKENIGDLRKDYGIYNGY